MSKKLKITLSEDATKTYLYHAGKKTKSEVNNYCEPSGSELRIEIFNIESSALMKIDGEWVEIGEVFIEI